MRTIKYGIFADDANKIFMRNVVPQLVVHFGFDDKLHFEHEQDFSDMVAAKSGEYVRDNFINAITFGEKRCDLELCFIGLDCDDKEHAAYYAEMQEELKEDGLQNNAIIFIPVQAIEFWLWYIKVNKENPNLANTAIIDSDSRKDLKKRVYNRKRPTNKYSNPIVEQLSQGVNFEWLTTHSASFKHFYDLFNNYLTATII